MPTTLTFVIPTHNRPQELRIAIQSIVSQIAQNTTDTKCSIILCDNGSEKETADVIAEFDETVSTIRYDDNTDYSVAFHRMMRAETEGWVWTFGDDDKLMPGALKFVLEQLNNSDDDLQFIHVAEVSRWSKANGLYKGTLLDLCRNIGWLEMTGFITGNICRANRLYKASQTPRWKEYAKSAFVHSCALLEELRDDQAVFFDIPCVSTQASQQTDDCIQRWIAQHIPERYLYASNAIERMFDDGILTEKLPAKFFRYQSFHLWDRFISHFGGDYLNHSQMWIEDAWSNVSRYAKFLDDDEMAQGIVRDVEAARGLITLHFYMQKNLDGLRSEIESIALRHGESIYPYSYATPPI